jgi:hypothetical protein
MLQKRLAGMLILATGCLGYACYYSPTTKPDKADSSYLSEVEATALAKSMLEPYGLKFVENMKLKREGVEFVADGYDINLRVGFEYRSHEGGDFEGEKGQNEDGLTEDEINVLKKRQDVYREYFLIITEGKKDDVTQAIDGFIKDLYRWEVLKKQGVIKKDNLFPDKNSKKPDLLPWETTGDLKKKRKEMESKEKNEGRVPKKSSGGDDSEGLSDDDSGIPPEPTAGGPDETSKEKNATPSKKAGETKKGSKPKDDEDWGEDSVPK